MTKNITFTNIFPVDEQYYPTPASKNIPQWYKDTESFINSKNFKAINGDPNSTIKKCIPVFDSLTSGYIIPTYIDLYVSKSEEGYSYYNWPDREPISFHPIPQAPLHPGQNGMPYPKWINPWAIKTDPGYSALFIPPMHNPNGIFTVLPGVVDTDSYINPVNFPFTLDDPDFEGMIPAGTPMVQVIPFKRDTFKMGIGSEKDIQNIAKFDSKFRIKFLNNYKSRFWHRKEYK